MKLRHRIHEESGSTLVAAVVILFIILGLGVAVLGQANVQSHQTGHEASGESTFNGAEGGLDSEANLLMQSWPTSATSACNQGSAQSSFCPGTSLTNSFNTTYAGHWYTNPQWTIQIIDDSGGESPNYYNDAAASTAPSYDANNDGMVWIRAQAIIGGQKRVVVAEMVRRSAVVALPHDVIVAGGTYTSNRGNKIIIESTDATSHISGPVAVRCTPPSGGPTYQDPCTGWDPTKGQLDPAGNYQGNYVDPNGGYSSLSPNALAQLKATAQANGTYYNGVCPSSLNGTVYVDNPPGGNCTYTGGNWPSGTTFGSNGPTSGTPGSIIFGSGSLYFNGNINYYGVIYMANAQGAVPTSGSCTTTQQQAESEPVFEVHGTAQVWGAVFVDKCGQVDAGDSKANINFISGAFSGLTSYETPALAKNTFRIIPNS